MAPQSDGRRLMRSQHTKHLKPYFSFPALSVTNRLPRYMNNLEASMSPEPSCLQHEQGVCSWHLRSAKSESCH
ncbi:hypothetical protein L209DRAFT_750653 [Thermothelomyces heterothallicus CBS 203.75]